MRPHGPHGVEEPGLRLLGHLCAPVEPQSVQEVVDEADAKQGGFREVLYEVSFAPEEHMLGQATRLFTY